jgi:tRNA (guanine37-N1)-methyltransferase
MAPSLPLPAPKDADFVYPVSELEALKPLIETKITHPALIIPARLTSKVRNSLKKVLMSRPKLKDVYNLLPEDSHSDASIDPKTERKIVLTDKNESYPDIYEYPAIKDMLEDPSTPTIRKSNHDVILGYDHYVVDQVLAKILPKDLAEIPSSFEVIGNLAHITLREEYYPYKFIIGRTILDKNRGIKVVANKIGTIQNEFRTFPMEILADDRTKPHKAGDDSLGLIVEVKEDGCRFQLDFEKVYWNSRLQYEHRRIVHLIAGKSRPTNASKRPEKKKKNDDNSAEYKGTKDGARIVVADACAGIGPFSIPLTSQYDNIEVYANDLNPVSYQYLKSNAKLNKCGNNLHT